MLGLELSESRTATGMSAVTTWRSLFTIVTAFATINDLQWHGESFSKM